MIRTRGGDAALRQHYSDRRFYLLTVCAGALSRGADDHGGQCLRVDAHVDGDRRRPILRHCSPAARPPRAPRSTLHAPAQARALRARLTSRGCLLVIGDLHPPPTSKTRFLGLIPRLCFPNRLGIGSSVSAARRTEVSARPGNMGRV